VVVRKNEAKMRLHRICPARSSVPPALRVRIPISDFLAGRSVWASARGKMAHLPGLDLIHSGGLAFVRRAANLGPVRPRILLVHVLLRAAPDSSERLFESLRPAHQRTSIQRYAYRRNKAVDRFRALYSLNPCSNTA